MPLSITLLCIGVGILGDYFSPGDTSKSLWVPLATFALFFFPGAISLFFVRKEVLKLWSFFALFYLIGACLILTNQDYWGGNLINNERQFYAGELSLILSILTIIWAITHSFMIRKGEKKSA